MITLICVSTRDLVDMGAICNGDRPGLAVTVRDVVDGVPPLAAGDGVKARPPGDANCEKSFVHAGFWPMFAFQFWFELKASLLSDDGVEKKAFGEALLNIMLFVAGD